MIPAVTTEELKQLTVEERRELLELLIRKEADDLSASFDDFVRAAWPLLEPSNEWIPAWHQDVICDYLSAIADGAIRRLVINIPPRFGKSLLVSVLWPVWYWTMHPESRWIFASYAEDLATKNSLDRRLIIESPWFRERWGHVVSLSSDQNLKTEFSNTRRGFMATTSVGGSITGKGGDFVVIDDPHNPKKASSDLERSAANRWFDETLSSRLENPKTVRFVVVMQRLHVADMAGHLAEKGGWDLLRLPMESEGHESVTTPKGRTYGREPGELLWPDRWGHEEVAALKRDMGSYAVAGQLQQRPSPAGGGYVKREWWKFYDAAPRKFDKIIQSWDLAFKETNDSDYIVGTVWGKAGADFYLLDLVRDRMDFPSTCRAVELLSAKWPGAHQKLVEDKANGPAVIDQMKHRIPGLLAVNPEGGKAARLAAVSPLIEAGNVHLPASAPWVSDFIEEFCQFPRGAHDDQVDSATQALHRLSNELSGPVMIGRGDDSIPTRRDFGVF